MPKERMKNICFNNVKKEDFVTGDIFWSCQNSLNTLFDYEIIDDDQRHLMQKSVIKLYGNLYPEMFPYRNNPHS